MQTESNEVKPRRKRADMRTPEQWRAFAKLGGQAIAKLMTPEQKKARAVAGALTAARSMTPEQRSERARKGAQVTNAKKAAARAQEQQASAQ